MREKLLDLMKNEGLKLRAVHGGRGRHPDAGI